MTDSKELVVSESPLARRQAKVRGIFEQKATEQRKKATAANTKRAYDFDWKQFEAWCAHLGYPSRPASDEALCSFLMHLSQDRRKRVRKKGSLRGQEYDDFSYQATSIERKLTAIVKQHRDLGFVSPRTPMVLDQMKAIWSERESRPKASAPVLASHLLAMTEAMDREGREDMKALILRDRAALLIGWHCAMRRSEIAALNVASVEMFADRMTVYIGRSKTDQEGKGRTLWIKAAPNHPRACPVMATREWIAWRGTGAGALFWGTGQRATRYTLRPGDRMPPWQMVGIIDRWTKRGGVEPESTGTEFSPHSLRSGFITRAIRKKSPIKETMEHSGHRSLETFMGYVRTATGFETTVQDGILDD